MTALVAYIAQLHSQCDFLLKEHGNRKEARAAEVESIQKAKAVLNGASYSFLEVDHSLRKVSFLGQDGAACSAEDASRRQALFQALWRIKRDVNTACVDMCKQVGSYPNCQCPDFQEPDLPPGVVTWPELFDIFDNLKDSGREM